MKRIYFLIILCLSCVSMVAQTTKMVFGTVVDEKGNPLSNAQIITSKKGGVITTDDDGTFSLTLPYDQNSLKVKYKGFLDKKVRLTDKELNSDLRLVMSPTKKTWFVNLGLAYSYNTYDEYSWGSLVLMGGFLNNWGGYAKIMCPITVGDPTPSFSLGVTKRLINSLYLYGGVGLGRAWYEDYYDYNYYDYNYHDYEPGLLLDLGIIYKYKKVDFNFGTSFIAHECFTPSIQLSVGYCF